MKKSPWPLKIVLNAFVFLLFLIVLAYALLRAYGYQYDLLFQNLVKTSIVDIRTEYKDVQVYLDDELIAEKTPYRILDVYPGDYELVIKKGGYLDWKEEFTVEPDIVSYFDHIILVPTDIEGRTEQIQQDITLAEAKEILKISDYDENVSIPSELIEELAIIDSGPYLSHDSQKFLYREKNTIWIWDNENMEKSFVTRFGFPLLDVKWYRDDYHFLLLFQDSLMLCDFDLHNCYRLKSGDFDEDTFVHVDEKGVIYIYDENKLISIDLLQDQEGRELSFLSFLLFVR